MKWYLEPDNAEFSRWSPRAFQSFLPQVSFPGEEPAEALSADGWSLLPLTDVVPTIPTGQTIDTRTIQTTATTATAIYTLRALTSQEIADQEAADRAVRTADANSKASALIVKQQTAANLANLSDEDAAGLAYVFDAWSGESVAYALGDFVEFGGDAYEVVQAHTSQAAWTPPTVPALFTPVRNTSGDNPDPWVQPTGAQDAYAIGDLVTHPNPNDGNVTWIYSSAIAANTTIPGNDGTFDRFWTPVEPL